MPRPKNKAKLSTDDLRRFIAGENGEIKAKMIEWAKGELARRERAGKLGGRPKVIEMLKRVDESVTVEKVVTEDIDLDFDFGA